MNTLNEALLTAPFGNRASGSVSGLTFQIGSGTIRLRLSVCRLRGKHISSSTGIVMVQMVRCTF